MTYSHHPDSILEDMQACEAQKAHQGAEICTNYSRMVQMQGKLCMLQQRFPMYQHSLLNVTCAIDKALIELSSVRSIDITACASDSAALSICRHMADLRELLSCCQLPLHGAVAAARVHPATLPPHSAVFCVQNQTWQKKMRQLGVAQTA